MTRLLVSVRSAEEARRALAGGASIIDVKEPANGPLGRASFPTWREVREVVPDEVPLSVALGELPEWIERRPAFPGDAFEGLTYVKLGLAGAGPGWRDAWADLRASLPTRSSRWIAVVYTDWKAAGAPRPEDVLDAMGRDFAGVLFDTWDKSRPAPIWSEELNELADEIGKSGMLLAIAGGLTAESLDSFRVLRPDVLAVRGAACEAGDRMRDVDQRRVAELVRITLPTASPPREG
ncbi:(5-formylfuran-3-yl)methyl phosphate synthase [Paludisphaera mucosa]|uniref:(5-formylfuran-3-yl)methyl phosphate synthase n=1 Tax=Paludisphaera mucosa TaxID=3030827 RepID=A0ABT6F931_9BACT|nr:(5-formylfuran-3-yl)methyl phosphate synthase [Paludisphaera mucosa]MDG3003895.1 (5-formylfuran-3-yl)methyl phosphate synthase [Paludisphaera mucosa]